MTTHIMFDFGANDSQEFTMGKACKNPSTNPCNQSQPCIYVIHNTNNAPNTVYVGYAQDANNRWETRTEVFHHFGFSHAYGKNVKCAWCRPKISKANIPNPNQNNLAHWDYINAGSLLGANKAEHLLMRAMIQGLMGVITVTNTTSVNTPFLKQTHFQNLTTLWVYFGVKFTWPAGNGRATHIGANY